MSDPKSMTIEQIREERRLLAETIFEAVKAFNEKTGLAVEYVQITNADLTALGEVSCKVLTGVEIELSI